MEKITPFESAVNQDKKINRRTFLKKSVQTLVSVTAGHFGFRERKNSTQERIVIKTEQADFYPLYENHTEGVLDEEIPPELDFLYHELKIMTPDKIENQVFTVSEEEALSLLRPNIRELVEKNIPIALGDIIIPDHLDRTFGKLFFVGYGAMVISVINELFIRSSKGNKDSKMSRRKFLGRMIGATGFALTGSEIISEIMVYAMSITERKTALFRVIQRLQGILDHTDIEDLKIFYRNLFMAEKLFLLSENYMGHSKIAFNVGAGHSGIEDLLLLGPEFSRWLLVNILPPDTLSEIIKLNEEDVAFASCRVISEERGRLQSAILTDDKLLVLLRTRLPSS